jgi:hypothetical protein
VLQRWWLISLPVLLASQVFLLVYWPTL